MAEFGYPPSWSSLKHASKRGELINYLTEISSTFATDNPSYEKFDIDECVHFFFDDTDLSDPRSGEVGYSLFDFGEAEVIRRVTAILDIMLQELGDVETVRYLAHPKWFELQRAAKFALGVISQHD